MRRLALALSTALLLAGAARADDATPVTTPASEPQPTPPGTKLDLSGLRPVPGFDGPFTAVPAFHTGLNRMPQPVRPLAADCQWNAGYMSGELAPQFVKYKPPFLIWSSIHNELEVYPTGDMLGYLHETPFSMQDGALAITASPLTPAATATLPQSYADRQYFSGAMNTYPCGQQYGYFEMVAKLPAGRGLWPAFWLLPANGTWPPEIDVMEMLGQDPRTWYATAHTKAARYNSNIVRGPDTSAGYHSYGIDWGPDVSTWYFDRKAVASMPTPPDWHQPMYLVANLAVGGPGSWPGAPNGGTKFPATMLIRSIGVWQTR
jgi:hypothetical protein